MEIGEPPARHFLGCQGLRNHADELMAELSDAFIAPPGGYGTLEEFCEILTWTQLGIQRKPCGILNVYCDRLLQMFDHAVAAQLVKPAHRQMAVSGSDPESLLDGLLACDLPLVDK